ncbi:MAG TPA: hypothetical protein VNL36_00545 [Bacteroidota bacterium]|nr:hypothetical protein [Bacteroidota bacterium]
MNAGKKKTTSTRVKKSPSKPAARSNETHAWMNLTNQFFGNKEFRKKLLSIPLEADGSPKLDRLKMVLASLTPPLNNQQIETLQQILTRTDQEGQNEEDYQTRFTARVNARRLLSWMKKTFDDQRTVGEHTVDPWGPA